jgi:hypothetical protein
MAGDGPDHGAEVEEARELLLEQPEPLRRPSWPQLAALAALVAFFAFAGTGRAASRAASPGLRALAQTTANSSSSDGSSCAADGEDCTASKCCAAPGLQCYKKNSAWASCYSECTKTKMPGDINNDTWDCKELGPRTPEPPEVDFTIGAERGKDCRHKKFCTAMDDHCYQKNEHWGSCMPKCDPSVKLTKNWTCKQLY